MLLQFLHLTCPRECTKCRLLETVDEGGPARPFERCFVKESSLKLLNPTSEVVQKTRTITSNYHSPDLRLVGKEQSSDNFEVVEEQFFVSLTT